MKVKISPRINPSLIYLLLYTSPIGPVKRQKMFSDWKSWDKKKRRGTARLRRLTQDIQLFSKCRNVSKVELVKENIGTPTAVKSGRHRSSFFQK